MKDKTALLKSIHDDIEAYFAIDEKEAEPTKVTFTSLKKSFHDDEQMIATDVVYAPFELDAHGEWMSDTTIKKACDSFNSLWDDGKISMNLFHIKNTDQIKLLKSYVLDEDTAYGDQVIKKGTWVAEYKFLDENLWKLKKAGVIGGLSICGGCRRIEPETQDEE